METLYDANNETVPLKTLSIRQEESLDKVFNSKALKSEVPSSEATSYTLRETIRRDERRNYARKEICQR